MVSLRWQQLIDSLEITEDESGREILSSKELLRIEKEHHIRFPEDYKEFCQILGTGVLGDRVRMHCPTDKLIHNEKHTLDYATRRMQDYKEYYPPRSLNGIQNIIQLLNSAFPFGDMCDSGLLFVWDLRTYHEQDDGYDIYWIDCRDTERYNPVFMGRSFFDFIEHYCYGTRLAEVFPELLNLITEEYGRSFFHFRPT
jgi:SMI1 / KNR4 family (SUKH-1)